MRHQPHDSAPIDSVYHRFIPLLSLLRRVRLYVQRLSLQKCLKHRYLHRLCMIIHKSRMSELFSPFLRFDACHHRPHRHRVENHWKAKKFIKAECPISLFILSASVYIIPPSSRREIWKPKASKNTKWFRSLNLLFSTRAIVVIAIVVVFLSAPQIPAQQRQSDGRVAMTTRAFEKWTHGREMASLEVDDAQRTLLPRDFTSKVGETQSGRGRLPPVEASPNVCILGEKQSGRNSSTLRASPLQLF